ncbi:hypothetical protein JK358_12035 [Nocardia sp. 2]|uniref:Lipoprotein n=1 Tax=Nocardia acididurans TaxID=2802282 RepID=A0ABS1M385_9NOCA|nr:hypothetical protein [Nocardia acididurans]MBL1075122.1 hypothetical protein [Nocardia acididurans]
MRLKSSRMALTSCAAVTVLFTGACGSDAPTSGAEPTIDLAALDVGNMPTEPKFYGKADSIEQAKIVEAWRLANHLPLPSEIMPEVKYEPATPCAPQIFISIYSTAIDCRVKADPAALNGVATGFVAGFVTTGRSDLSSYLGYELYNLVMIFSDEKAAADAAQAMGHLDLAADAANQSVPIPKYPNAVAYTTDDLAGPGQFWSWYATSKFVIFTRIFDGVMAELKERDLPKLIERVERSIDAIAPRVAEFEATPPDKLMDLTVDPDAVLARAVPTVVADQSQNGIPGVYDRRGGLQISPSPRTDVQLFEETGVDRVAWKGGYVYRTRDSEAAQTFVRSRATTTRKSPRADSPANLPDAKCRRTAYSKYDVTYHCVVSYDRYVAEVSADQLLDAQQRIAAQYAILVNSK